MTNARTIVRAFVVFEGCVVNDVFWQIQFFGSLLDGILAAHAFFHQLLHSCGRILFGSNFLHFLRCAGDDQHKFTLGCILGVFFNGST